MTTTKRKRTVTTPRPRVVVVQAGARWGVGCDGGGPLLVGGLPLAVALAVARKMNRELDQGRRTA